MIRRIGLGTMWWSVLLVLVMTATAHADVATKKVSVNRRGGDAGGRSYRPSISADGRYVAFDSTASDLAQGDANGASDIFVRDLVAGTTVRASVDTGGGDPNGYSYNPSISADGRYVAFDSSARDLVQGDGNHLPDIFVRDVMAGTTVRGSVDIGGGDPNGPSYNPSISADGRYVAFTSYARDLVQGDGTGIPDIFVRDLVAGTTMRASVDTEGGDPNGDTYESSISADGRYVAFTAEASDLVQGDGNGVWDVFVRDLVAGTTVRASVDTGGGDPNGYSFEPSISANGQYVTFYSDASDLVQVDGNATIDVFVRDVVAGTTVRASVDIGGGDPNGGSFDPSITADGRYVAFRSYASNLVAGDGNDTADVFVRDLVAGTTIRASVDTVGGDPNSGSESPSISADGRYVAFRSYASDLVPGDRDRWKPDVFIARWQ